MKRNYETEAKQFCEAIKALASKEENLENMECYLSMHFEKWLSVFASTPADIVSEMQNFAEMEVSADV